MYIYHALINTLSAHMIHINLNTIFYAHLEHSPTKTIPFDIYLFIHLFIYLSNYLFITKNWHVGLCMSLTRIKEREKIHIRRKDNN